MSPTWVGIFGRRRADGDERQPCGLSVLARPRITGASAAALIRRSASASASKPGSAGAERLGLAALGEEALRRPDDLQRVGLALLAGLAPGGDAVAAEDAADRLRVLLRDRGDVQAELEARPAPRHPDDAVAEALAGQLLAVGRRRQRDARVGVQVVDVRGPDQPVHRGVDRRRGAAAAVQAEVERGDHLVLALDARVDVDQRAEPVQPQHGQARLGEGAEVAAGALHPEQLDRLPGDRVGLGALGGGVAAGVVGVARVGAEPVAPVQQIGDHGVRHVRSFRSGG